MGDDPVEISFGQDIPEEVLSTSFGLVSVVPPLAPELSFRVALANDWEPVADITMTPLECESFSIAAAFQAPEGDMSFEALATSIPFEVGLADWLEIQSGVHGFELLRVQSFGGENGEMVHAVARAADGAHLRLLAAGNGASVLLCLGRAPEGAPEAVIEALGLAAATFEFTEPEIAKTREPVVVFTDRDRMFQVLHPQSWSPEAINRLRPHKAGADFRLADDEDLLAYLRVEADTRHPCDQEGLERVLDLTLDEIYHAGVAIQALEACAEEEDGLPGQWMGDCTVGESPAHIAIRLRPTATCWLTVIGLYPLRESEPWSWMRGKRAYEIASATVESSARVSAAGASSFGFEIQ